MKPYNITDAIPCLYDAQHIMPCVLIYIATSALSPLLSICPCGCHIMMDNITHPTYTHTLSEYRDDLLWSPLLHLNESHWDGLVPDVHSQRLNRCFPNPASAARPKQLHSLWFSWTELHFGLIQMCIDYDVFWTNQWSNIHKCIRNNWQQAVWLLKKNNAHATKVVTSRQKCNSPLSSIPFILWLPHLKTLFRVLSFSKVKQELVLTYTNCKQCSFNVLVWNRKIRYWKNMQYVMLLRMIFLMI